MKILHTADVHLREDDPKTVEGLKEVLAEASNHDVDLLTIGGDLFDSPKDAEALRGELRDLFDGNPFDILAIPGNHDEDVYRDNLRFGNDIKILTDTPYHSVEHEDIEFIGVPFRSSMTEELYSALEKKSSDRTQVLLLHCTLDIGFQSGAVGEGEGKYFPVTKATLADLGYDYVLGGHIHSKVREVPLGKGGTFIYPGSPVSHSTKEEGRRNAVLLDTEGESVSTITLDTFYYDSLTEMVRPGEEDEILERIENWVARRKDDDCELEIKVDGFTEYGEDEFLEDLETAADPVKPDERVRTAAPVIKHPLYQRFLERLDEKVEVPDREKAETRVIEVLSQLLAENKVQST